MMENNDYEDYKIRSAALKKITSREHLKKIAIKARSSRDRIDALNKLNDQATIEQIAFNDIDYVVRRAAIEKLNNQEVLSKIALDERNGLRKEAIKKLKVQSVLTSIALEDEDYGVRMEAIKKLNDQSVLAEIALKDKHPHVRKKAFEKLIDQNLLSKIALENQQPEVRMIAVRKLTNQNLLADIALEDEHEKVQSAAIKALTDQKLLAKIALKDNECTYIGTQALVKISDKNPIKQSILSKLFNNLYQDCQFPSLNLMYQNKVQNEALLKSLFMEARGKPVLRGELLTKISSMNMLRTIAKIQDSRIYHRTQPTVARLRLALQNRVILSRYPDIVMKAVFSKTSRDYTVNNVCCEKKYGERVV
ncbi:MAG: HEAT repeat domain-containing protein, partial [Kangiellaceae bacterium]|nr:HEAT repeat domain-containing protein [Kangiellaceae bacterium]